MSQCPAVVVGLTAALFACHPATPVTAPSAALPHADPADAHFMSGMITHHAQAVLIAGWSAEQARGASASIRTLCERIVVAQKDEIALAQQWLSAHGEKPMDHAMMMPGMLTAEQLAALQRARGPEYDRLFLTLMIQHHEGALTMVAELLAQPGAAQDGRVFRFAADVHADQTTEIERMRRMLAALTPAGENP